jgi:hypothetical protein
MMKLFSILFKVVGELGFRSKFLSSSYQKAICVCIDDVKIIGSGDGAVLKAIEQYRNNLDIKSLQENYLFKMLGYLRHILPPAVMIFFQVSN